MVKNRPSKEQLEQLYLKDEMTCPDIAKHLELKPSYIFYLVKKYGIPTRDRSSAVKNRKRGKDSPSYKGGTVNKSGYRLINHDGKQRLEHRVVMEQVMGRKLNLNESVHHINGNKLDNRPENLEIIDPVSHSKLHAKERSEKGISNHSNLNNNQIIEIRRRRASGEVLESIAKDFDVSTSAISRIALGETWNRGGGAIISRRTPAYLIIAREIKRLQIQSFSISDKDIVMKLSEACGRPYGGKKDDAYISEAISQYAARGGKIWIISYRDGSNPTKRERVFTINEMALGEAVSPERC